MRGRRRRGVHEFSRRSRAPDDQRADRRLASPAFTRERVPKLGTFVCLTSYGDEFARLPAAFTPQSITHGFGEIVAGAA